MVDEDGAERDGSADEKRSVEAKEHKERKKSKKSRKSKDDDDRSDKRDSRSRSRDRSRRKRDRRDSRSRSRDRSRKKRSRSRSRRRSRSRDRSRRSRSYSRERSRRHRHSRSSRSHSRRRSRSRSGSSSSGRSNSKKGNWDQPPTGQPAAPTLPGPLPLGAIGAAVIPGLLIPGMGGVAVPPAIAGVTVPPSIPGIVAPVSVPKGAVGGTSTSGLDPTALLQQIAVAQQASSSRQARRIYIGNLPTGAGLTEASMTEFFNQAMMAAGLATIPPVASVWLSTEGKFGFVELRTPPDAQNCLLLDGATLHGRQIRVGRPKDFIPGVHDVIANGGVPSAQAMAAAGIPGAAQVLALMGGSGAPAANIPVLAPGSGPPTPSAGPASKVISLSNMVQPEDLADDKDFEELQEDIRGECSKHGTLEEVVIPRPHEVGFGKIYVKYHSVEDALRATGALTGRKFGGNPIGVHFVDEGVFERRELS